MTAPRCAIKPGLWPGFLLAVGLISACGGGQPSAPAAPAAPAAATSAAPPLRYDEQLRQLDLGLADVRKLMAQRPDDALLAVEPVKLLLERARLTGNYANYTAAAEALEIARRRAGDLLYPCVAAARLHYALHRLDAARAELQRCPNTVDAAELAVLRADLDFYSGRYRQAEETYLQAVNQRGQPDDYIRLALFRNKTGSPGEAAALLEAAEQRYFGDSAMLRAWLKLQRGLVALDRGRHEEARALYLQADREMPGWWLVEEHVAEVQALLGNVEEARQAYRAIIARTGLPEFMDTLAQLEADAQRKAEAQALLARAEALYRQRIAAFPEAAAGHALDHFLSFGSDAAETLRLAEANYRSRPHGDAAVGMARALQAADRPAEAIALLSRELEAGWRTPELLWLLGDLHAANGETAAAERLRDEALALNPASRKMYGG